MDRQITNLAITGFSGTGKSLVAREVARRLNWNCVDTDDEIVRQARRPIADIFRDEGEAGFRELERGAISKASRKERTVIAVGGGAIVDERNYEVLARTGIIVCLEARAETIYERLFRDAACSPGTEVRPLLRVDNPLERIRELKASRQPYYARADWTVHTDVLSVDEVAEEVVRAWNLLSRADSCHLSAANKQDVACVVETATQSYPVFVGYGLLDKLGEKMKQAGLSGAANIISDANVFSFYGDRVEEVVKKAGFAVNSFVLPAGEETKRMGSAVRIYDSLVRHRTERDDVIVALGGGVVGDLAGFVAATFLRGISWVQVPTSLIAMVDASIGGKVGVNHPRAKNLIGAFYQPCLVLADCQALATLPQRELTSGWAEVIKHGLVLDGEFIESLEADADELKGLKRGPLTRAVARSAAIKAGVVSRDEKERQGTRTLLNYGHTIGHALEAAAGYKCFLHGEAVAIGMMGAARLSLRLGLLPSEAVQRQESLLKKFGLPTSLGAELAGQGRAANRGDVRLSLARITRAMELDKKVKEKTIRWVLLEDIGRAVVRSDVPHKQALAVLRELSER